MIALTKLNAEPLALGPDLIEHVEGGPQTIIAMVDGTVLRGFPIAVGARPCHRFQVDASGIIQSSWSELPPTWPGQLGSMPEAVPRCRRRR